MVKSGQEPIKTVPYLSPAEAPFPVEVMSFGRLRAMGPLERRTAPQRPRFHVLALVTGGDGHHTADFVRYPLAPDSAVWIRPGVVHQWDGVEQIDGTIVLFQPDFLAPGSLAQRAADDSFGPVCWTLPQPRLTRQAAAHLSAEYASAGYAGDRPLRTELLRNLLAALLLRALPDAPLPAIQRSEDVFVRFRALVERDFARSHQVAHYAALLGYSPRTLSRATQAAAGQAAKEFIDRRVLLEAKRMLAHGSLPAARCAAHLGFDDAANFAKFFRRFTGTTPGVFRASFRA